MAVKPVGLVSSSIILLLVCTKRTVFFTIIDPVEWNLASVATDESSFFIMPMISNYDYAPIFSGYFSYLFMNFSN